LICQTPGVQPRRPAVGQFRRVSHSHRQALFLLGIEPIRTWASVWCLSGLSAGKTPELATLALLRARACELGGAHVRGVESSEAFLVGLFSLLDAMLNRTMTAAIQGLPLSAMASAAL
jgi:EAL and modified HD-GYP domain-containing signal transduction protein